MRLLVFLFSAACGAVGYLCFAAWTNPSSEIEPDPAALGAVTLERSSFDGEFRRFVRAEDPVDLGCDSRGLVFVLQRDGVILKSGPDQGEEVEFSPFFRFASPGFDTNGGCSHLAVHPDFLTEGSEGEGKLYLVVTERRGQGALAFPPSVPWNRDEVIYELRCRDPFSGTLAGDQREVMRIAAPGEGRQSITDLAFDHRACLIIGVADLEGPGQSRAMDLESGYGKVLRIDPIGPGRDRAYRIPRDNPFYFVSGTLPELWAYGLCRPHSISVDPFREWICISDSGRDLLEEINLSGAGAEFFGWDLSEGSFLYPLSQRRRHSGDIVSPRIEYARGESLGKNVGGVIYRGERFPFLDGRAVFADESGRIVSASLSAEESDPGLRLLETGALPGIRSLKAGPGGELFAFCETGEVFELRKSERVQRNHRSGVKMLARTAVSPAIR